MALTDQCLSTSVLECDQTGTTMSMRIPWYRSLPFSSIVDPSIEIDNATVVPDQLEFEVGDGWVPAMDLGALTTVYWFIQDPVRIRMPALSSEKNSALVRVHLRLLMPYLLAAPGTPATLPMNLESVVPILRKGVEITAL